MLVITVHASMTARISVAMTLPRVANHRAGDGSIENLVADAEEEQKNDQAQRDSEQPQEDQQHDPPPVGLGSKAGASQRTTSSVRGQIQSPQLRFSGVIKRCF